MENSNKSYSEVSGMFDIVIVFILLFLIAVSEVKSYEKEASKKKQRAEERAIVRKIKVEHIREQNIKNKDCLDEEFREKYNVILPK